MMHRKQDSALCKAILIAFVVGLLVGYVWAGPASAADLEAFRRDLRKDILAAHCLVAPQDCVCKTTATPSTTRDREGKE